VRPWWLGPRLTTGLAAAAALTLVIGADSPIRVASVLLFLGFAPGATVIREFVPAVAAHPGPRLFLSIAISLVTTVLLGQAMVLVRWWHPNLGVLLVAAAVAAAGPLCRHRRAVSR
jgi:uncharacterized membrane protein